MKKLVCIVLVLIGLVIVGVHLYSQPEILHTQSDLVAVFSENVTVENPENITMLSHITEDTAWFFFLDGGHYYAMRCEVVGEEEYVFSQMEDLFYYTADIVYTKDLDGPVLINDPRCTHIQVVNKETKEETNISVDDIPMVVSMGDFRPASGSWGFRDEQGNDLHHK